MPIRLTAALMTLPAAALADVPTVMTDIAPIHSLTAQVMGDLGTPDLLLPPGADPHDFALRPSDAEALGDAELVIWVGEALTPWLEEPLETLAPSASHLALLETEGWDQLAFRDLQAIGADDDHDEHDHGDHDDHDDHDHDAHDHDDEHDHAEEKEAAHDDHDHDHDHGAFDPHGWVDPSVAKVWVASIAEALSAADPENAPIYEENAAEAVARIDALDATLTAQLSPLADRNYILPHDGYQYFEARYGLTANGALATGNAETPGPAQIAALRDLMDDQGIVCVFSDTSIPDRWASIVTEGTAANTAPLDAVGLGLEAGPDLYAQVLTRLGDSFASCLGD